MIVSQPALLCLSSLWNNLTGRASVAENHAEAAPKPATPPAAAVARAAAIRDERRQQAVQSVSLNQEQPVPPQEMLAAQAGPLDESQLTAAEMQSGAPGKSPLSANETRARAAALSALAFSRTRRFDAAQAAFEYAARLDPRLDLTRVPNFWSLERAAHEAAISAYVAAGRTGDAAVLRAKVQSVYRPKPIRSRKAAATV